MIDRQGLRYFLAVVDQGNFSAAARHCRVSQPTLSVSIARLEDQLGRAVFKRTSRRVELTQAGVQLVGPARRVESGFIEAEQAVLGGAQAPTIRVGVLSTLPTAWIQVAVAAACRAGNEQVEIVDARAGHIPALLERGRIDAAIGLHRDGRSPCEDLWTEGYALALPAGHALSSRRRLAAEDVAGEIMFVRRDCEALGEVSRYFTSRGVRPFMAARTYSEDRAIAYVRTGLGVTVMPRSFVTDGIVLTPLDAFETDRTVSLLLPSGSAKAAVESEALRRMIEALRSRASRCPDVDVIG